MTTVRFQQLDHAAETGHEIAPNWLIILSNVKKIGPILQAAT